MRAERAMVFACVLGMLICIAVAARAEPADKDMHFIAGVGIGGGLSVGAAIITPEVPMWKGILISGGLCVAAGAGKEILDEMQHPPGDPWDFAATSGGCAVGVMLGGVVSVALGRDQADVRYTVKF